MGQFVSHSARKTLCFLFPLQLSSASPSPLPLPYPPTPLPMESISPPLFSYQYQVHDDITKNIFSKTESQAPDGSVRGSFSISLPDGRVQTTSYTAHHQEGFTALVEYEGSAVYPQKTASHRPQHHPAQYTGKDRRVLSYTPSPYVASSPYKSSLAFSPSQEQTEDDSQDEEEEINRRKY
eukprot:TRINITY_DN7078_c0_g1_i1.p1 TRINITY_DN7078_c0_g1~~TRINITY_DN7078_c0_g1_i1.p1  ORF type:complete len:180 (-),score=51.01 TRINITY_DN7078_c0_g1_i1:57-596(-)